MGGMALAHCVHRTIVLVEVEVFIFYKIKVRGVSRRKHYGIHIRRLISHRYA